MINICPDQIFLQDKNSHDGNKNAVFISNLSNFLQTFSSFSVQNLTQDILIKAVEIVCENWEATYFYCENDVSIFNAKIQVNLCF